MDNFDFTQFITFDSALPYGIIKNNIESIFIKKRFSVVDFKDIEKVKKDYFSIYWRKYSFELKKDDFLCEFMEWEDKENIPIKIKEFVDDINETLMLAIRDLRVIICSFAEKEKTYNEYVCINQDSIYEELFKMSPFSFVCPDNLIIRIIGDEVFSI